MQLDTSLGFLGFGNMGQAILQGLLAKKTVDPQNVWVCDADAAKVELAGTLAANPATDAADLARNSGAILLATKPQDMGAALDSLKPGLRPDALVISIAAGISIGFIQQRLGLSAHVARVMPNTPAMVGAGAAGMAFSETCTDRDARNASIIFSAVGLVEEVREDQLDLVTALVGSGPAYFFYFVECMIDAAVNLGLAEDQAIRLARQTCYGAGRLLDESPETPAILRERVTSKGGTTHAALESFRRDRLAEIVRTAMAAAANRSRELGQ